MNTYEEDEVKSMNSKPKKFQFMDQVFENSGHESTNEN